MDIRFSVRREADSQKQHIMETFESLKKRGKLDPISLQSLGLDIQIKEDPKAEREQDLDQVKSRQAKEVAQLEEQEKKAEQERLAKIAAIQNPDEKDAMEKQNLAARALAQDRMIKLLAQHEQELKVLQEQ